MKENNESCAALSSSSGSPVPLEGVKIYGDIIGRGAKVKICQHFRNIEENPIEAVYKFPLPESATICGFRAVVGDKIVEGEIEEKEKAFDLYDKALSEGDGAQLLDQDRPNIFTLSVGNIKAHESTVIEISYIELLDSHDSEVRFYLPTTISPRYIPDSQPDENGISVKSLVNPPILPNVPYGLNININIHGKNDIAAIESPSHTINTRLIGTVAAISFSSDVAAMDRDFILNVGYEKEFLNKGYQCRDQHGTFIQLDFGDDETDDTGETHISEIGRDIVFVLDCSGSMSGESIREAKKALNIAIKALKPGVTFNIYLFGSTFNSLYPHSKAYNKTTMSEALKFIDSADATLGGTDVLEPLRDIYKNKPAKGSHRDMILVTDGEISNEEQVMELAKKYADHTNIYPIGIGSGPNEFFIKSVARASGGTSEMIAPYEKIEKKLIRLFKKVLAGRIQDFKIDWGVKVLQSPENPIIFQGKQCSIFAQLKDVDYEINLIKISGQTISGMKEWIFGVEKVLVEDLPISKLWARERIRDIEEGRVASQGSKQKERADALIAKEIIDISKKHGIISSKTSFIGIEKRKESEKSIAEIVLRKVPTMLTTGWGGLQQSGKQSMMMMDIEPQIAYSMVHSHSHSDMSMFYEDRKCADIPLFLRKDHNQLKEILSLQRSDGGFDFVEPIDAYLYLSPSDIRRFAEDIEKNALRLKERLEFTRDTLKRLDYNIGGIVDNCSGILKFAYSELSGEGTTEKANAIKKDIGQFGEAVERHADGFSGKIKNHIKDLTFEIETGYRSLDPTRIVMTIIVLLLLEVKFNERKSEWKKNAQTSRNWLDDQFQRVMLKIDQQQLEYKIREFVHARVKD